MSLYRFFENIVYKKLVTTGLAYNDNIEKNRRDFCGPHLTQNGSIKLSRNFRLDIQKF